MLAASEPAGTGWPELSGFAVRTTWSAAGQLPVVLSMVEHSGRWLVLPESVEEIRSVAANTRVEPLADSGQPGTYPFQGSGSPAFRVRRSESEPLRIWNNCENPVANNVHEESYRQPALLRSTERPSGALGPRFWNKS